jgi:beta-lactamase superfamily II metal-dependent hydrolase
VPTTRSYTDLLTSISNKGLKITTAKVGTRYDFGEATLKVLAPLKDYDDLNNMSVVCKIEYKDFSLLMTGDAEKQAEQDLLNSKQDLSADVLKVGHHGSNTSSTKEFLQAVGASKYVIHVGKGNSYGHPHSKTLERLNQPGKEIYRTDLNGNIIISTDGTQIKVKTSK